jgi:hypothetical protein
MRRRDRKGAQELNAIDKLDKMVEKAVAERFKQAHKKVKFDKKVRDEIHAFEQLDILDSDDSNTNKQAGDDAASGEYLNVDECLNDHLLLSSLRGPLNKRINDTKELVPVVFAVTNTGLGKRRLKSISVLLDSSASSSVISHNVVDNLRIKPDQATVWNTAAGRIVNARQSPSDIHTAATIPVSQCGHNSTRP